jgi:hypothetical protein
MKIANNSPALWRRLINCCLVLLCLHTLAGAARAQLAFGHDPTDPVSQNASGPDNISRLVTLSSWVSLDLLPLRVLRKRPKRVPHWP